MLIIGIVFLILEIIVFYCLFFVMQIISTVLVIYVHKNRRITPAIQLSESLEELFIPYSVDELVSMHSPHVEEVREWTASHKHLLSSQLVFFMCGMNCMLGNKQLTHGKITSINYDYLLFVIG